MFVCFTFYSFIIHHHPQVNVVCGCLFFKSQLSHHFFMRSGNFFSFNCGGGLTFVLLVICTDWGPNILYIKVGSSEDSWMFTLPILNMYIWTSYMCYFIHLSIIFTNKLRSKEINLSLFFEAWQTFWQIIPINFIMQTRQNVKPSLNTLQLLYP